MSPVAALRVSSCVVLLGKVILARTVSTPLVSLTLAAISMVSETLKVLFSTGMTSKTDGGAVSMVTFLVSVMF